MQGESSDTPTKRVVQNRLSAVPALAARVVAQGTQNIYFSEVRTKRLHEIQLAVGRLPQHEIGDALLPRRSDDEIDFGLTGRVKMRRNVVEGHVIGQSVNSQSALFVFANDVAYRLRNLVAAAVADGEVDVQAAVAGSRLGRRNQRSE